MTPKETLTHFLDRHKATRFGEDYYLTYNEHPCHAFITELDDKLELTIKPLYSNHDIGQGAGIPITQIFDAFPVFKVNH